MKVERKADVTDQIMVEMKAARKAYMTDVTRVEVMVA